MQNKRRVVRSKEREAAVAISEGEGERELGFQKF